MSQEAFPSSKLSADLNCNKGAKDGKLTPEAEIGATRSREEEEEEEEEEKKKTCATV